MLVQSLAGSENKAPYLGIGFQGSGRWPYLNLRDEAGGLKQVVCLHGPESRPAQNQWSLVAPTPTLAPAWFISHQPSLRSQSSKWFPLMARCPSGNLLTLSPASISAQSPLESSRGRRERISPVVLSLTLFLLGLHHRWSTAVRYDCLDLCAVNYGGSKLTARKTPDCTLRPSVETQHWVLWALWDFPLVFALSGGNIDLFLLRCIRRVVAKCYRESGRVFFIFLKSVCSPVKAGRSLIAKLWAAVEPSQAVCFPAALNAGLMAMGWSRSTLSLQACVPAMFTTAFRCLSLFTPG